MKVNLTEKIYIYLNILMIKRLKYFITLITIEVLEKQLNPLKISQKKSSLKTQILLKNNLKNPNSTQKFLKNLKSIQKQSKKILIQLKNNLKTRKLNN
jgi:hypothetical protein